MNADHVVRFLRQLRYARRRGRPIAISWVAIQSGCGRTSLYNAIVSGHISEGLADRIGRAFQNVQFGADLATLSYDGGPDPRGGRRPVRRRDDRRLRAVRALRGTAGANASLGPHGGRRGNALSRGPRGGASQIGPRGAACPSEQTPAVTEQGLKNPATIRIDVGRLLTTDEVDRREPVPAPDQRFSAGTIRTGGHTRSVPRMTHQRRRWRDCGAFYSREIMDMATP